MKLMFFILIGCLLSILAVAESGFTVWADASDEASDTGNEVCAIQDNPPQYLMRAHLCTAVFVPGSATEIACDVDMTDAGTDSDYYLVLCH